MRIEQIYTGCLAQGSYYIQSEGEAAIIDPLREVAPYLQRSQKDKVQIKYIFETHFHADFVSGHVSLAQETDAIIVYGPNANPAFQAHIAQDGEEFKIGKLTLKALHTPGHTMESTCFLLKDENNKDRAVFTGDTLFLGDVGRPDLAQGSSMTTSDLAGFLYDSLRTKIMPLNDDVIVYPAHGAGSACGKNMMQETVDTLGNQKKVNYALRADMTKAEFIEEVTADLPPPPPYFPANVKLNKEGYSHLKTVLKKGLQPLNPNQFEAIAAETEVLMLDVRPSSDFIKAHIPNSIFIGLEGNFAQWVGELIVDLKQPIVLIAPEGREEEAITRLARVGFDNTIGYLEGGVEAWTQAGKATAAVENISTHNFSQVFNKSFSIIDLRKPSEYKAEHIETAKNIPLSDLNEHLGKFSGEQVCYVHCKGGYRSVIGASLLKAKGIHNLVNIAEGFNAIKNTAIPVAN